HFADASVYSTKLGAVSALREDDLHSFVGAYLAPKRARIVYVKPVRSALAADEKIETTHAAAKDRPRPPAADRVDTTAHVPSIGQLVKTVRLANGLEVLISKRATLPVVTVKLLLHGGRAHLPRGMAELARYALGQESREHGTPSDFGAHI